MKNFLLGFMTVLLLAALITAGIFAYLYSDKNTQVNNLTTNTTNLNTTIAQLTAEAEKNSSAKGSFKDTGEKIDIQFPTTWSGSLETKIGDVNYSTTDAARLLTKYEYTLVKNEAKLTFTKIMGGVDGFPIGLKASEVDYKEVSTTIIRYKAKSETNWKYVTKLNCDDYKGGELIDLRGSDICVSPFGPGFGQYANTVILSGTFDEETLSEADAIVISTK